jgi:hypothetical protein
MIITINGKPADITLETEKTIGEILAGLESWLAGSGHYLSGLVIDGKKEGSIGFENSFSRELAGINTLDILTSSWAELAAEALLKTRAAAGEYENTAFEEKSAFYTSWEQSPEAQYLAVHFPDLHSWALQVYRGEGLSPREFCILIDEALRELSNPLGELESIEPLTEEISRRLEDIPLDVQTGNDGRAAETVRIFSQLAEKLFRIFSLLKAEGFAVKDLSVDGVPVYTYIDEFGTALKELLAAYEDRDLVLAGDLAEYELAPRLRKLYRVIRSPAESAV